MIYKPINQMEAGKGSLKDLLIKMSFMQAKDQCLVIFPKFLLHVSSPFFPPHRELGSQPFKGDPLLSQGLWADARWVENPPSETHHFLLYCFPNLLLRRSHSSLTSFEPSCPQHPQVDDWLSVCVWGWNISIYRELGEMARVPACYPISTAIV